MVLTGKPTRRLWIAAITVSVICVVGLAYGLVADWNTPPDRSITAAQRHAVTSGSGFTLGLLVGLGAGVVLGTLIALRKRDG